MKHEIMDETTQKDECVYELMCEWMFEWINEWTNRWENEWMNAPVNEWAWDVMHHTLMN